MAGKSSFANTSPVLLFHAPVGKLELNIRFSVPVVMVWKYYQVEHEVQCVRIVGPVSATTAGDNNHVKKQLGLINITSCRHHFVSCQITGTYVNETSKQI